MIFIPPKDECDCMIESILSEKKDRFKKKIEVFSNIYSI